MTGRLDWEKARRQDAARVAAGDGLTAQDRRRIRRAKARLDSKRKPPSAGQLSYLADLERRLGRPAEDPPASAHDAWQRTQHLRRLLASRARR